MEIKGRAIAAMSGGVDSSVAAALAQQQGFEVIGLTMKLFERDTAREIPSGDRGCCDVDAIHRAAAVCNTLNIPHYSIDLKKEFEHHVINDFVSEYIAGRTPNPCVRCNSFLKWGSLFQKARQLDCDYLITGHYSRIAKTDGEFHLLRASSLEKDQSYALWGIPKDKLACTLFPLGDLQKSEVRKIAADLGLKSATTPESQEICFIPDGHYTEFVKQRHAELNINLQDGVLIESGIQVGQHDGYIHYTVGQRKGLGGGFSEPRYVLSVDAATNVVEIGVRKKLQKTSFQVDRLNWLALDRPELFQADVQIRYRMKALPATIEHTVNSKSEEKTIVHFNQPVEAITPGQSAVFYRGDKVLGGGRIIQVA
jgi:tRNA-uridine 2-sulfurtransferase